MSKFNENEVFLYNIALLQDLMGETLDAALSSYEVLTNGYYENEESYQLSLGYLTLANQSYLAAKVLCTEKGLEASEINPFFDSFKEYKREINEYIVTQDDNSSWLSSRIGTFRTKCDYACDFISNTIKDSNRIG